MLSTSIPTIVSAVPLNLVTRSPVFIREFIYTAGLDLTSWIETVVMQLTGML